MQGGRGGEGEGKGGTREVVEGQRVSTRRRRRRKGGSGGTDTEGQQVAYQKWSK